jgi:hypothetical protein
MVSEAPFHHRLNGRIVHLSTSRVCRSCSAATRQRVIQEAHEHQQRLLSIKAAHEYISGERAYPWTDEEADRILRDQYDEGERLHPFRHDNEEAIQLTRRCLPSFVGALVLSGCDEDIRELAAEQIQTFDEMVATQSAADLGRGQLTDDDHSRLPMHIIQQILTLNDVHDAWTRIHEPMTFSQYTAQYPALQSLCEARMLCAEFDGYEQYLRHHAHVSDYRCRQFHEIRTAIETAMRTSFDWVPASESLVISFRTWLVSFPQPRPGPEIGLHERFLDATARYYRFLELQDYYETDCFDFSRRNEAYCIRDLLNQYPRVMINLSELQAAVENESHFWLPRMRQLHTDIQAALQRLPYFNNEMSCPSLEEDLEWSLPESSPEAPPIPPRNPLRNRRVNRRRRHRQGYRRNSSSSGCLSSDGSSGDILPRRSRHR